MMELRIISPTEDGFVREIRWNNEELKQEIAARMAEYTGLVLTDDQIGEGKKELAKLRKLKDALESERKRIKSVCLEPYQKFEAQVKEITALIDAPIQLIDGQIKEYDQEKKIRKMNEIHDFFDANVGDLRFLITFPRVMDAHQKWLNAGVSMKSIQAEILDMVAKINADLASIESLGSRYDEQIRDVYLRTLDLSQAMQEKARLEEQERRLAERRAAQEAEAARQREQEERRAAEEAAERQAQADAGEYSAASATVPADGPADVGQSPETHRTEPAYVVGLEVFGTRGQLDAFCLFLKENGIRYRVTAKPRRIN